MAHHGDRKPQCLGFLIRLFAVALLFETSFAEAQPKEIRVSKKYIDKPTQYLAHHDKSLPLPKQIHPVFFQPRSSLNTASVAVSRQQEQRELQHKPYMSPLYPGYGTHFVYLWIGSPPQRQSVIVDTGSHYTAFPCTGCSDCGQHTDVYFSPESSSTASIPYCGDNQERCIISQTYNEGSEWTAYEVYDRLWVGGIDEMEVPTGEDYVVNFKFGCQTAETGLFKSQLADGIMGLSIDDAALPIQLRDTGVADSSMFALCFHLGGGIFTLGGVDQRIHLNSDVRYAKLTQLSGLYTVTTNEVSLVTRSDPPDTFGFGLEASIYNGGKGTIVDSGTTDTFLPTSVQQRFNELFLQITGVDYTQDAIHLTYAQVAMMPNIVISVEGVDGNNIDLEIPASSYVNNLGGGKYAFRIYFQDDTGIVLGGNFFLEKNIIFDADNQRIGFAQVQKSFFFLFPFIFFKALSLYIYLYIHRLHFVTHYHHTPLKPWFTFASQPAILKSSPPLQRLNPLTVLLRTHRPPHDPQILARPTALVGQHDRIVQQIFPRDPHALPAQVHPPQLKPKHTITTIVRRQ